MKDFTETIEKDGKQVSFHMIHVKGGSFMMGNKEGEYDDERPIHEVNIPDSGFYIGKFPVTQDLYEFIMGENPSHFKRARNPIEQVSWNDTQTFIKKLNDLTSKEYRLPSESEWEYAARGGIHWKEGFRYSGSNDINEVAWYGNNSHRETKEVGLLKPNQLGIHDMSGNVYEWCEDRWHDDYHNAPTDSTAWVNKEEVASRVIRGGSWYLISEFCRVAYRSSVPPSVRIIDFGFRLVLSQ